MSPPRRTPTQPALIPPLPEPPLRFDSLDGLARALTARLDGAEMILTRVAASYPGFDTFTAFTVTTPAGAYIGCAAIQETPPQALDALVTALQSRSGQPAAA